MKVKHGLTDARGQPNCLMPPTAIGREGIKIFLATAVLEEAIDPCVIDHPCLPPIWICHCSHHIPAQVHAV